MWGEQSRFAPPADKTTRHSGTAVGKIEGVQRPWPGAVAQDHTHVFVAVSSSEPFSGAGLMISSQKPVHSASSFFFFPDQRHSRKNGIYMFKNSFQQLFVSFFCVSGSVHVVEGARVCEWRCGCTRVTVRVFKGLWELVRLRYKWLGSHRNKWLVMCLSVLTNRENCPPQWVLAKLALFILNIYNMCACTVLCN